MAKSRRNRAKSNRPDPLTKPKEVKPPSDPQLAALREKRILPIVKDLQSTEPKKRGEAASAISVIIEDEKCRKLLLREQIVYIVLTETLTDASLESRAAGWEILKVLAQFEEADFCVHLFRSDVLTAIENAFKLVMDMLKSTDPVFGKTPKAQQHFVWEVVMSATSLLNDLAAAKDEILEVIVSNSTLTQFLFFLVKTAYAPAYVLENVLSCLITLSEDNRELAEALVDDQRSGCFPKLLKYKESAGAEGALACGLLHNIFSVLEWHDHSPGRNDASDAVIIPSLCRVLGGRLPDTATKGLDAVEIQQLVCDIFASIGTGLQEALEKGNRDFKTEIAKNAAEEWNGFGDDEPMGVVNGKSANGADSDHDMDVDDDGEGDEDGEDEEEDEEMDDDAILADMERVTGNDDAEEDVSPNTDLPQTLNSLIRSAVPALIPLTHPEIIIDVAQAVQMSALAALNNIAWSISCIDFTEDENKAVAADWLPAARNVWSKVVAPILAQDTADINLATMVTSLAWALARVLGGGEPIQDDEFRKFMALYKASSTLGKENNTTTTDEADDPFQSLGVKCIGVLGQMARNQPDMDVNRQVGVFLVSVLAALPKTPAAEAVEALDQLFDLYGDETNESDKEVFWKDGFLAHLEAAQPKVKAVAKTIDKRKNEELRTRVDEALVNLDRFVKYKRKHAPA